MADHGGRREGAGRPAGSTNKRTQEMQKRLKALSCDPVEFLARVCNGERILCTEYLDKEKGEFIEQQILPTLDQRISAAKDLLPYTYPKLKAIEHSGDIGGLAELDRQIAGMSDDELSDLLEGVRLLAVRGEGMEAESGEK